MAENSGWRKIVGLINGFLKFGFKGPMIKKNDTDDSQLDILANNGVSDAKTNVAVSKVKQLEVRGTNGNKTTVTQPDIASDILMKLPTTQGNAGEKLTTDGAGNLSWAAGESPEDISLFRHVLNYNTASPASMMNFPENFRIKDIVIEIVTPFDGAAPTLSVGLTGDIAKYVETTDTALGMPSGTKFILDVEKYESVAGSMIATINPDASSAGQVIVTVSGCKPVIV